MMAAPTVYSSITGLISDLAASGIAKTRTNETDGYKYRSIDDILDRLSGLLAKHRLCVLPQVLEREVIERRDDAEHLVLNVALRVAFSIVSAEDGSSHVVEAYGEALDPGDKATAKAMSAAYKSAMVQTFCIPVSGADDPEKASYRFSSKKHIPEPAQGWEQWSRDIIDIVTVCESEQAIDMVQDRHRDHFLALSRERADIYDELGRMLCGRRETLRGRMSETRQPIKIAKKPRSRRKSPARVELENA
jgi:hypothetical protein